MESVPSDPMYIFTPDTSVEIRKRYNLDGPGRMDDAINLLEDWIKKQNHFVKKDFPRDYLERCIIFCKGSVEKAKKNIDSLCTLRTLMPQMYGDYDFRNDLRFKNMFESVNGVILPKFAPDYHRVFILKCTIQRANKQAFSDCYRYLLSTCDYWRAHDYSMGFIIVLDYRNMSVSDYIASLDLMEAQGVVTMCIEGYKTRIKAFHILSPSTTIQMVVKVLKQIMSPKIRDRFYVHSTIEELYEMIPKDILPQEYGGKEKSLKELQGKWSWKPAWWLWTMLTAAAFLWLLLKYAVNILDDWIDVLSSKEHKEFVAEMNKAAVNENYRLKEKNAQDITSMSGTFRSLNVD